MPNNKTTKHKTTKQPIFDLARLRAGVRPFRVHFYPRLRSTNDHAAVLRGRGALFAPAIVLTSHQTAGRGRGGNRWFSDGGCLTVTFAMPIEEHLQPHQLPLVAGLAVRSLSDALLRSPVPARPPEVQLKWPNDVYANDRKLAGMLCERVHKCDLIGIGLNVNLSASAAPPPLCDTLTSLADLAGQPFDMTEVLIALAGELRRMLLRRSETTFAHFLREYDQHHLLVGRNVTISGHNGQPAIIGRCEGLDHAGRLLVRDRTTVHRILAGHVAAH